MHRREFMAIGGATVFAPASAMAESAAAAGNVPSPSAAGLIQDSQGEFRVRTARAGGRTNPTWLQVAIHNDHVPSGRNYVVEALLGQTRTPVIIACGREGDRHSANARLLAMGPLTLRITIGEGDAEQVHELSLPVAEPSILAVPLRASAQKPVWRRCRASEDLTMSDPLRAEPAPGCVLITFKPETTENETTESELSESNTSDNTLGGASHAS